jgi:quinoprotein glucose dehydrogenase
MLRQITLSLVCVLALIVMPAAIDAAAPTQTGKTTLDGVYTQEQANRGKAAVESHCAMCHQIDLAGGQGPALKGQTFMGHYVDGDLGALFSRIKTSMPRGNVGGLSDDMYIDIVAYILQANAFPSGNAELSSNLAKDFKIVALDGAPAPVPDFALVQLVGCLARGPDNTWVLNNTSAPVRTRSPTDPTAEEISAAKGQALGSGTFRLLYVDTFRNGFNPADYTGHKMEGRGFLITKPDNRLSITWLEMVDSACAP